MPPRELRYLVGPLDDEAFDNPTGRLIFSDIPAESHETVFDFGCGCGRLARQLIQQTPAPRQYVGVDLNRKLVDWCVEHLAPAASAFQFQPLDIYNAGFNPEGQRGPMTLPMPSHSATLMIAWSVFAHVVERDAVFYLREAARMLRPDGVLLSTWFVFDKREYPMMQDFQNALFINDVDPTNAVIFDREWLLRTTAEAGLTITAVKPPNVRSFQWQPSLRPTQPGQRHAAFPEDLAPHGRMPPPLSGQ